MAGDRFDPVAHAKAMRDGGFWVDKSYDEFLQRAIEATPNKAALIVYRADRPDPRRLTYAEFGDAVARAAASLRRLGVGRGDVISVQLPNWLEFAIITLAAFRVGAIVNPLMPIFRERELTYMLDFAQSKMFVTPKVFRGFDHEAMAKALRPGLPALEHVVIVDGEGPDGFESMLLSSDERLPPPPIGEIGATAPAEMSVLMFTSGTTGSPKGVMHCLNTLMACNISLAERFHLSDADTMLVCSPLGHMTGFAAGMLLGFKIGATVIFQDIWEPKRGVAIMAGENVTFSAGAATFLTDMCEAVVAGAARPPTFAYVPVRGRADSAGADRARASRARRSCLFAVGDDGISVEHADGARARAGQVLDLGRASARRRRGQGHAARRRRPAAVGETGVLKVRGAQMTLGYYKRPDMEPFDAEGWFDTGDLAYMDEEGYIRISGRIKDIIIRGGENVPIVEIEGLLFKHPAILAAALVGYPDSRLGERACAFLILRPGESLDLRAVQDYMAENKVAKQYWPERIEIVDDLPKTPAGKIQKFQLREKAKAFGDAPEKGSA